MKAFPTAGNFTEEHNGMDLRDYFASKAMQSLAVKAITDNQSPEDVAIASYMFADELMKARKESQ